MSQAARVRRAAVAVLVVLGQALVGVAALPRPALAQGSDTLPVQVTLLALGPRFPAPHDTVDVAVRLTNRGDQTVENVSVALDKGGRITNRSELAAYATNAEGYIGYRIQGSIRQLDAPLAPGGQHELTLSVPVDDLSLGAAPAIYGFGVDVRGSTERSGYDVVGRLRTFLPWAPAGSIAAPTRLAWVWPVVDVPHRAASTTFRDDRLAPELAGDGRLRRLVDVAAAAATPPPPPAPPATPSPTPAQPGSTPQQPAPRAPAPAVHPVNVSWAIDPLLVQDVSLMAAGYRVGTSGEGRAVDGATAADFLAALRAAVHGADVVALPYADVDVDALTRAGMSGDVEAAIASGAALAGDVLHRPIPTSTTWPPDGQATLDTVRTLFAGNVTTVLLRDTALPVDSEVFYTPDARTNIRLLGGSEKVVLTDTALSDLVTMGAKHPSSERWAEQRFLAETLLITEELPSRQRSVVVAPERRWSPSAGFARALLNDTARAPWLQPTTVDDIRAHPADEAPRAELTYPSASKDAELPGDYLRVVQGIRQRTDEFESILTSTKTALARELYLAGLRMESSAWRDHLTAARTLRTAVAQAVDDARSKVRVLTTGLVTLTSKSGAVPITVANQLDQPVQVLLRVDAGGHARVVGLADRPRVLPAGQFSQLQVHMEARTSGVFRAQVTLFTPTSPPRRYGATNTIFVRPTAYGTLALGITGGAFAVLLIAVAVRLTRRALRAHRSRAS